MDGWLDVVGAARVLGVSPRQVRALIDRGALPAERVGGSWLVVAEAARSRAAHSPGAGRPLSPDLAWHLLAVVQYQFDQHTGDEPPLVGELDRRQRHRLRQLLATPASGSTWARRLAGRADRRRYWAHPGAIPRLAREPRLRAGGRPAAAADGVGSIESAPERFYVDADQLAAVEAKYRLVADHAGRIELMVVPAGMPRHLLDGHGPVPGAVAMADLLESDDARERHAAATRLEGVTLGPGR